MGKVRFPASAGFGQMRLVPLLLFTLFWCGLTGGFAGFIGRNFYRAWDARQRYVPAEAVVLASGVQSSHDHDGGTTYGFGIRYRYRVDGVDYESDHYTFGGGKSSDGRRRAADLAQQHPVGSHLTVYVDPRKPAEAVADRRTDPMMLFLLLFLQPFILVGLGMLGACIAYPFARRAMRRFVEAPVAYPLRVPTWGVLRLEEGAGRRYVLTPRKGVAAVLLALAAGYGGTCFAAIFIVGFLFGGFGAPKLAAIVGAFATAIAAGITAAAFSIRAGRRKPRLVVDASSRTVAMEGPSDRTVVPFSDVESWAVGTIENPRRVRQNDAPARVPLLSLRRAGGEVMLVHVFMAQDESGVIAARCAEILASLSGHPATGAGLDAAQPQAPAGSGSLVQAALAALKEKQTRADRLRDLT